MWPPISGCARWRRGGRSRSGPPGSKQIRAAWKQADPRGEQPRPEHGTGLLRARAYLALLLGQPLDTPPADLLPPADAPDGPARPDGTPSPEGQYVPAGLLRGDPVAALPPLAGSVAVTLPLATLLGLSDNPGDGWTITLTTERIARGPTP